MKTPSEIWQEFESKPGAVHNERLSIASENAIDGLVKSIVEYQPTRILELGAGIGTLTYAILDAVTSLGIDQRDHYRFISFEDDPFCLNETEKNLQEYAGLYDTITSPDELDSDLKFDLIIVDGPGFFDQNQKVEHFQDLLETGGIIFVEGKRAEQRRFITESYRGRKFICGVMPSPRRFEGMKESGKRNPRFKTYRIYKFDPNLSDRMSLLGRSFFRRSGLKVVRLLHSN